MNDHKRVCIIGGGIMGVSALYHLALEGWKDIILIEKGELTSGSTWHAAGQCPHFVGSLTMAKIHHYGTQLYPELENKTGQHAGWHECGGIRLALTDEEVNWFKYVAGIAKLVGFEYHLISPKEIEKIHPFVKAFDVKFGALTISDGHVDPTSVTNAMAKGAKDLGAQIRRNTRATNVTKNQSGEWEIKTDKEKTIICEHVVNAAGSYAQEVASWSGIHAPITNMLHQYIVTEALDEIKQLENELPVIRDPYCHSYLRQEQMGLLVGPYEQKGAKICFETHPEWDFDRELLPPDTEHLEPYLEKACERIPLFGKAGIKSVISGAITHTPDGNFLLGPAQGEDNYWMACGASIGICQGGGAGKYLAQWMVHGQAEVNMAELDPRRFGSWADQTYTKKRAIEDYQEMYTCYPPGKFRKEARKTENSPLYNIQKENGAIFGEVFGRERPLWFDKSKNGENYSFKKNNRFIPVGEECIAVRENVGLMDASPFAKFDVKGENAHSFLNHIFANNIPNKKGAITLAHMLTQQGMIESEATITCLDENHYYVVSGAAARVKDYTLMKKAYQKNQTQNQNGEMKIRDVTDEFGVLVIAGPNARNLLRKLTNNALDNYHFPWLSAQNIDIAGIPTRALRVTYFGELGWELHAPADQIKNLYHALHQTQNDLKDIGIHAMNSLRMEKAYRGYGTELTNEITLIEADMKRFVGKTKNDFIGKNETEKSEKKGPRIKLVYMKFNDPEINIIGNEPIFDNEKLIGVTTSGAYGYAAQCNLAFAYVEPQYAYQGAKLDVQILKEKYQAEIIPQPIWDPNSDRAKA